MSLIDVMRRLLTIDQAERLGLSRRTVERKIEQGVIPAFQLGGRGTAIRIDERGRLSVWVGELNIDALAAELARIGRAAGPVYGPSTDAPEPP